MNVYPQLTTEHKTGFASKYNGCSYKLNYFASYYKKDKPNESMEIVS